MASAIPYNKMFQRHLHGFVRYDMGTTRDLQYSGKLQFERSRIFCSAHLKTDTSSLLIFWSLLTEHASSSVQLLSIDV